MNDSHDKALEKIDKLLSKGKTDKALKLSITTCEEYESTGLYLQAAAIWKKVLQMDPHRIEAHLKLIALQQQLGLMADVEVQKRLLEESCKQEGISAQELAKTKACLGIIDSDQDPPASAE